MFIRIIDSLGILPIFNDVLLCKRDHPINPEKYPYVFTLDIVPRRLFLCAETKSVMEMWLEKISEHLEINDQHDMRNEGQVKQFIYTLKHSLCQTNKKRALVHLPKTLCNANNVASLFFRLLIDLIN